MNASTQTYIATATEYGKRFTFKVLGSRARSSEYAGTFTDFEAGVASVEQKYGKVTWVTPYRFAKETSAC